MRERSWKSAQLRNPGSLMNMSGARKPASPLLSYRRITQSQPGSMRRGHSSCVRLKHAPGGSQVQNVSAAVALANGDVALAKTRTQETIASAKRAGEMAKRRGECVARARSDRTQGRPHQRLPGTWSTALSMDKSMDAVERIALDLLLLARLELRPEICKPAIIMRSAPQPSPKQRSSMILSAQTRTLLDKAASQ